MASEDILSIPRQERVIWVTKACDLGFKARLELWQSTVGLEFQRHDHWVSMMVDDQIIATHWCPRWFLDEPVKFKSRFLLQNHLTGLLLELLSPSPSRNQKSGALTNHRISARQMQSPNFKSQVLCSWRPWISEISPHCLPQGPSERPGSDRCSAVCQTCKARTALLRWERIWEISASRAIFPQGCHEHLKARVYNGSANTTVTMLWETVTLASSTSAIIRRSI